MAEEKDPESKKAAASPWPSARRDGAKSEAPAEPAPAKEPAPSAPPAPPASTRAAWAAPIARLDRAWTRLEARFCAAVLLAEVLTLTFWITVRALSNPGTGGAGFLFRCIFTGVVLGVIAHRLLRGRPYHELVTTITVVVGFVIGRFWGNFGQAYFANLVAWMQNASLLVFFGGVSEVAKRLTLWLALLGASVATGQGKHINVDVVLRFLGPRARVPIAVLGWLTAAVVSATAAWGFFDDLAVEDFHAPATQPCPAGVTGHTCSAPPGVKIDHVEKEIGRDLFLASRQLSLDLRAFPKVLGGTKYNGWLTAAEWNTWVREGGWEKHFAPEDVKALELPPDYKEDREPAVTSIPGSSDRINMLLVPTLNLVFPFGLLVIAIRFVIRSILAITGWVKVDPNAAHGEDEELVTAHDHEEAAS